MTITNAQELQHFLDAGGPDEEGALWSRLDDQLRYFRSERDFKFEVDRMPEIEEGKKLRETAIFEWERNKLCALIPESMIGVEWILRRAGLMSIALAFAARFLPSRHGSVPVCLGDQGWPNTLSMCANAPSARLIPDHGLIRTLAYLRFRETLHSQWTPWHDRRPIIVWRGAANGPIQPPSEVDKSNWDWLPRAKLCETARDLRHKYPIDAKLTGLTPNVAANYSLKIEDFGSLFGDFVKPAAMAEFRYVVDIDGFSNAWSGLHQKLLTGSTVLKVESPRGYQQWYYDRLEPWTHYVPIKGDLSDLEDALDFVMSNESEAEEIGFAGRNLALSLTVDEAITNLSSAMNDHCRATSGSLSGQSVAPCT